MKDKVIIFAVAMLIIFLLGAVAHIQYFHTKHKIINLSSERRTVLARQAAVSLESFFSERIKAIEILANMHSRHIFNSDR
ncbi:MAG: hypothetical protein GXO75_01480, partial [Calditrichaeota bacterium]|nr:hypothetical protein [Calditrichota bacterium]